MSAGIEEMASTDTGTVEQSTVLSEGEVAELTGDTVQGEAVLTSEQEVFEMPEKFAGKSAEEIAKSYMELEKFKAKDEPKEGGDEVSKKISDKMSDEEDKESPKEEKEEPTKEEAVEYQKYVDSYQHIIHILNTTVL